MAKSNSTFFGTNLSSILDVFIENEKFYMVIMV